jgi:hypothetical protein
MVMTTVILQQSNSENTMMSMAMRTPRGASSMLSVR